MAQQRYIKFFGDIHTRARYQALFDLLCAAIEHHKLTGETIGYNVLGALHPNSLTRLLPPSDDNRATSDSVNLKDQIHTVLTDEAIVNKYGVYDLVYNSDENIEPRFDFYIVPVPVGRPGVSLTSFLNKAEQA